MSRRRGDWDEDFDAGGPRRREEGPPFGPPRGYEYDERERPREGRRMGLRGDYDDAIPGRGRPLHGDALGALRRLDGRRLAEGGRTHHRKGRGGHRQMPQRHDLRGQPLADVPTHVVNG